jgi:8-oxo-dGTP pyrophosphatase MutT (NUDIX family)
MHLSDAVVTAGAYALLEGRFPFVLGPTPCGDRLAVIRLGGHREAGETPWQCVVREALEEAGLMLRPCRPPTTYWVDARHDRLDSRLDWRPSKPDEPQPLLFRVGEDGRVSAMYLALAEGKPEPRGEVRALLLLTPEEVRRVAVSPLTLAQLRAAGGVVLARDRLPEHLPLEPFPQIRLLAQALALHPDLPALMAGT